MAFEIEKKYSVLNFDETLSKLKSVYGEYKLDRKSGFWFCETKEDFINIVDFINPIFTKKSVAILRGITEINIPEQDFHYARLRVSNGSRYILTLKNKSLVNGIEQNVEYEYELPIDVFKRVFAFLKEEYYVYYYNIKESFVFTKGDLTIELSRFNDLKSAYIEVELVGEDQQKLTERLEKVLISFKEYNLREEPRSYRELSDKENAAALKNKRLETYSKEGVKSLTAIINSIK